jgi:hypothetical protein
MQHKADFRRRLLGAAFLGAALLMLVVGQTVLRNFLQDIGFLLYWLVCIFFTFLAVMVAFRDLSAVRHRTREEQRALLEDTLAEIARRENAGTKKPETGGRP